MSKNPSKSCLGLCCWLSWGMLWMPRGMCGISYKQRTCDGETVEAKTVYFFSILPLAVFSFSPELL